MGPHFAMMGGFPMGSPAMRPMMPDGSGGMGLPAHAISPMANMGLHLGMPGMMPAGGGLPFGGHLGYCMEDETDTEDAGQEEEGGLEQEEGAGGDGAAAAGDEVDGEAHADGNGEGAEANGGRGSSSNGSPGSGQPAPAAPAAAKGLFGGMLYGFHPVKELVTAEQDSRPALAAVRVLRKEKR
jgi:hypothetical protein